MLLQMLGLSLLTFRHPKHTASKIIRAASGALTPPKQGWIGANGPVLLMYMPVHFFFTLWVLSFVFMPRTVALSLWAAFLVPYYVFTHQGNPAHTGTCVISTMLRLVVFVAFLGGRGASLLASV